MKGYTRMAASAVVALAGVCAGAGAGGPPTDPLATIRTMDDLHAAGPTNAALVYYRAIIGLPSFNDGDLKAAMLDGDESVMTREAAVKKLEELQGAINTFCRAAALEECDFGLDFDHGFELLLPHLGKMRMAARLIASDAVRLAEAGEADAAAARLAALYGIARHVADDGTLIGSLVGVSIASLANQGVERLVSEGKVGEKGKAALVSAFERLGDDDPFFMRRAIAMEGAIVRVWLSDLIAKDGMERFIGFVSPGGIEAGEAARLRSLSQADATAAVGHAVEYYEHAYELWEKADAVDRLAALGQVATGGGYGPIGKHICASVAKAYESDRRVRGETASAFQKVRAYRPAPGTAVKPAR
ncbi:MAG: hypothetical protein DYG93_05470 [Leptolyngbya sp. PLA2]|nr:hypothetical protein [Leptolyngbya sp.]MCE7971098.1 hypothetical protein [Leptolyngbya sp. PL-A2]MCQ3940777.1 hypothetical protein [cyanobacterium CYA1]MCZ7634205.1 hypothetical protein [Phycisphaerales bacterium]MDL1905092.1 hypothetical protein [Synechococcales cyanobacterium CNB]GIK19361.1 MAG: hypothetical protein BroJett004_15250 [Planctomycetota bacterium]